MIDELERVETETDEPPIGFVRFDLRSMTYADLVALRDGSMTQTAFDDLLERVVIGGHAAIPIAYLDYALGDLLAEVNARQSPKVRLPAKRSEG